MKEIRPDDLAPGVEPLTDDERKWIRSLERVLRNMPERLLMIECGDVISVVDRKASREVDLEDGNAERNGVLLAHVDHSVRVLTGVSG